MYGEKKFSIVLASVLKPVHDTRMFGKLGVSLAKIFSEAEIHVIGAGESLQATGYRLTVDGPSIIEHPLGVTKRVSIRRLFGSLRVLIKVLRINPTILIITTHELLWVAMLAKLLTGCTVVYDVQENYYLNILNTEAFPKLLRPFVANYVRLKEWITSPLISHFILAEKAYQDELPFTRVFTILENKVIKPKFEIFKRQSSKKTRLLFSGTLVPTTGVLDAIEIAKGLHRISADISLVVIGYSSAASFLKKLKAEVETAPFITLVGGDRIVPHEEIEKAILNSDAGIIAYPPNPSTIGSIPTKLYEYWGYQLPIIMKNNARLFEMCKEYPAAVEFSGDYKDLFQQLQAITFYNVLPKNIYWEDEESKLRQLVDQLI